MVRISIFFFTLMMIASCGSDDDAKKGSVELLFRLKYGSANLAMFDHYSYPTGEKIFFSRFGFYISNVQLKSGESYKDIKDIDYLNMTNAFTGASNVAKGFSYKIDGVDEGSYSALRFTLGVPQALNDKTPAAFSSSHILSQQAEYWGDWKSYIFTRTEGQIDYDGDGVFEESFGLHTGSNAALRTIEFPISKNVAANGTTTYEIQIDMEKQFGNNPYYDIVTFPQIHSTSQSAQVKQLIDNLSSAFTIQ